MTNYGEITWEDDVFAGSEKKNSKDLFIRLDEGDNELRIITQPHQYLVHKYKREGAPPTDFGQKINCSQANDQHCPLCAMGEKPKTQWLLGVISRKTGAYRILDISYAVFSQIRKLARNTQRWGDPMKYDINIIVDKKASPTQYYTVQPVGKEPLSAADQDIKDRVDLEDLKRRITPPNSEYVQKRMDKINGVATPSNGMSNGKPVVAASKTPQVNMADDEELSATFPSYDQPQA